MVGHNISRSFVNMKYILKAYTADESPEIDIDREYYESIKRAKSTLSNGLVIEEKYEILISNYLDFETELLSQAAQQMIRRRLDIDDFHYARIEINRKLVNLLATARMYRDQVPHQCGILVSGTNIKDQVVKLFSEEYDKNLEYRFMEALRNHAQHRGLPVHSTPFRSFRDDSGEESKFIYSMDVASQKTYLEKEGRFKKKVLEEIPDKVDLKHAARIYIEGISRVHASIRGMVDEPIGKARSLIECALRSYGKAYQGEVRVLYALCLDDNDDMNLLEEVPLLLDWDDIRLKLVKLNPELINLRKRHVSGETKAHGK
jgi:hypothetical protein